MKQITVIGDANATAAQEEMGLQTGRIVAEAGYSLVCGGLKGVMAAACRGHRSVKSDTVTIGILPGSDASAANHWVDVVIPSGMDVARNALVVASGQIAIAIGGGAGTLSEIAMASQLGKPTILYHGAGGWVDRLDGESFLDRRKAAPLLHANSEAELRQKLTEALAFCSAPGQINSGHLESQAHQER